MGLSCRLFLLDQDNGLYRLPNTTFDQMLRDPTSRCWPEFAGTRMRMTNVVVELLDRRPIRVVWITFGVVRFDSHGYFDQGAFDRQQRACAELALAPLGTEVRPTAAVIDAADRFVAQGGRWTPSRTLARRIDEAALGRVTCPRL